MRKIWQLISVAVVSLGLGLAVVGCGSSTTAGKMGGEKMSGDKMGDEKMGGKMGGEKMSGEKMDGAKKDKM
jgi:hypothetical protein